MSKTLKRVHRATIPTDYDLFEAGMQKGVQFALESHMKDAPRRFYEATAENNWILIQNRIHEAAQVGRGDLLTERLAVLGKELAAAAAHYSNLLKLHYKDFLDEVQPLITHITEVASKFQDAINTAMTDKKDQGAAIRSLAPDKPGDAIFSPHKVVKTRNREMAQERQALAQMLLDMRKKRGGAWHKIGVHLIEFLNAIEDRYRTEDQKWALKTLLPYCAQTSGGEIFIPHNNKETFRKFITALISDYSNLA